ncbi:MAG TPA: hypothetical protein VMI75_06940 [Polyangiaceae bacterium]|nr:hypothetical protein [Polyangiaceae bacterium]
MRDLHPAAAVGFARAAEVYERARPSYPADAVAWLAERCGLGAGRTVVDLGAGNAIVVAQAFHWFDRCRRRSTRC